MWGIIWCKNSVPDYTVFDSLQQKEDAVRSGLNYKKAAAAEGGNTGGGGILPGLADFPILLNMKLKLLFDIAIL